MNKDSGLESFDSITNDSDFMRTEIDLLGSQLWNVSFKCLLYQLLQSIQVMCLLSNHFMHALPEQEWFFVELSLEKQSKLFSGFSVVQHSSQLELIFL